MPKQLPLDKPTGKKLTKAQRARLEKPKRDPLAPLYVWAGSCRVSPKWLDEQRISEEDQALLDFELMLPGPEYLYYYPTAQVRRILGLPDFKTWFFGVSNQ